MNYSTIIIGLAATCMIILFIRHERLIKKEEIRRRLYERDKNAREWQKELKETSPELYKKVFGKKNNLH